MKRLLLVAFFFFGPSLVASPGAQAAPTPVAVAQGSGAISVSWSGTDGYVLELRIGGSDGSVLQSIETGLLTGHTFTGLLPNVKYTVVLRDSDGSNWTTVNTPASPPGQPTITEVTSACKLHVKASWKKPDYEGSGGLKYTAVGIAGRLRVPAEPTSETEVIIGPFNSSSDSVIVEVYATDTSGVSSKVAISSRAVNPTGKDDCPSTLTVVDDDPGTDSDSGTGGNAGGGGGGSSASDGEALPGVPKSLAGADRVATSIAVAEADFLPTSINPTAQSATLRAQAAVIASSASFPDALAAGPLAYAKVAPLLLTGKNALDSRVSSTLTKLVPAGSTVYIVGGEAAVSANVATAISNLGFTVQRIAGLDRYETSVKVAQALGNPTKAFAATGLDFPDALSAGVIAARQSGSILLTRGGEIPLVVAGYLLGNPSTAVTAVGGPAASAFPTATSYKGADRYATAVALAEAFPPSSVTAGVASGRNFPDGLVAAPYLARRGGVLVLTQQLVVPSATSGYIKATTKIDVLQVFGGLSVVSDTARRTLASYL